MKTTSIVLHYVLRFAPLVVGALLLLMVFRDVNIHETAARVSGIGILFPAILSVYFIGCLFDTLAWHLLLSRSIRPVPFVRLFLIHLAGESFYRFLPAGILIGESVKVMLVQKHSALQLPEIVSSLMMRKLLMGITQSVYIGLAVLFGIVLFTNGISGSLTVIGLVLSAVLLLLFVMMGYFLTKGKLGSSLFSVLNRIPIASVEQFLRKNKDSFLETDRVIKESIMHRRKNSFFAGLLFLIGWCSELFETWFILLAVNAPVAFGSVMVFEPIVSLLRSVAFIVPAGIGVMDAGYAASMQTVDAGSVGTFVAAFIVIKRIKELFWVIIGVIAAAIQGAHFGPTIPRPEKHITRSVIPVPNADQTPSMSTVL